MQFLKACPSDLAAQSKCAAVISNPMIASGKFGTVGEHAYASFHYLIMARDRTPAPFFGWRRKVPAACKVPEPRSISSFGARSAFARASNLSPQRKRIYGNTHLAQAAYLLLTF